MEYKKKPGAPVKEHPDLAESKQANLL